MKTSIEEMEKRRRTSFRESSNCARLSFIIAVMLFFLTGILMGAASSMLIYGKYLVLCVIIYVLIFAFVGLVLGYLSLREDKNIYGVIGFFSNFAFFILHIIGLVGFVTSSLFL